MILRPSVLCPIDFSGSSRGALRYATAIAAHFGARLTLTAATSHQLEIARGLAEAIQVPIVLLHVVEPVRTLSTAQPRLSKVDAERRYRAERELESAIQDMPPRIRPEALVAYGERAEEIAKVATDRDAGVIVMGLHSSPVLGPRMGSVTYRVLCLAHRLVLAIPPVPVASRALDSREDDSYARERIRSREECRRRACESWAQDSIR